MKTVPSPSHAGIFQNPIATPDFEQYVLRLFVAGTSQRSLRAITNIKRICEKHLEGHYKLEVVDVYQQPTLARTEQIVAVPTLVKLLPLPLCKMIGDMANTNRTLSGLGINREHPDEFK